MFGAGNEPTADEFFAMFPAASYDTNSGELLSAPVNNVKVVGKNLAGGFEDATKNGITLKNLNDGSIQLNGTATANTSFVSKDSLYPFNPSTTYRICVGNTSAIGTEYSDSVSLQYRVNAAIVANSVNKTSATLGNSITSIFIYVPKGVKCSNFILKPQITTTTASTDYSPSTRKSISVPQKIQELDGYGWTAGTAKNWVDWENKKYHKEVAKLVVADSYIAEYSRSQGKLAINQGNKAKITIETVPNVISASLRGVGWTNFKVNNVPGICAVEAPWFHIQTTASSFADVNEATQWMIDNCPIIYFELATPEIIDISDILTDDNVIEVEEGGSITFENSLGSSYRIPVSSEVVYQKKVTTSE